MFIHSGKYVASQSDDKSVRIWKTADWKEENVVTEPFEEVWLFFQKWIIMFIINNLRHFEMFKIATIL